MVGVTVIVPVAESGQVVEVALMVPVIKLAEVTVAEKVLLQPLASTTVIV